MGRYAQVFVVPRGTRDRIIAKLVSYRQAGLLPFCEREPTMPARSGGLFVRNYDPGRDVWVTTPLRWLEIVSEYCDERNIEFGDQSEGPMYEDACAAWLQKQLDLDLYEIVITEET